MNDTLRLQKYCLRLFDKKYVRVYTRTYISNVVQFPHDIYVLKNCLSIGGIVTFKNHVPIKLPSLESFPRMRVATYFMSRCF